VLGDYYNKFNIKEKAITYYNKALQREIPNIYQKEKIEKKLTELQE
jgi:hypothetical protein